MKPNPKISVIIPTFNRIALLKEAVDSVLDQRYAPAEIIIVDDGSTDGTRDTSWPPGVRLIAEQHQGMPGRTRNLGIQASTGNWLAFLDSDDLWSPNKLELQVQAMEQRPEKLIHCREIWNRDGRILSQERFRHQRDGDLFPDSLKKCIIGPSTVIVAREVFEKVGLFREDLEVAEDYELWLRITRFYPVAFVDTPLVTKRAGHGDQLSEKYGQIEIFRIQALRALVDQGVPGLEDLSMDPHKGYPGPLSQKAKIDGSGSGSLYQDQQERQQLMIQTLIQKLEIYAKGADKRGRHQEALGIQKEIQDLRGLLTPV